MFNIWLLVDKYTFNFTYIAEEQCVIHCCTGIIHFYRGNVMGDVAV